MSRSLTLSVMRRAEPASSTRSDGRVGSQRRDQLLADGQRPVKHDPPRRPTFLVGVERREQRLLGLLAETAEVSDPVILGGGAQRLERVDPELIEQPTGALGAEPGQPGHRHQPGWELRPQLLQGRDLAGVGQRQHLLLDDRADPRKLRGAAGSRASAETDVDASRTALAALR